MRILIVDDEALARSRLSSMLQQLGAPYEVAGEAANGLQAVEKCQAEPIDLVLMDVRMPGMDGLQAAARLAEGETPPTVIFTTAYDEHALAAFERNASGYLLKPIKLDRLRQALQRAQQLTRAQLVSQPGSEEPPKARGHICSQVGKGLRTVPVAEILYFQAEQKYVVAHLAQGEILLEEPLKSLEQEFADSFLRIHRSTLVAKKYLTGMEKDANDHWHAILETADGRLEISRRHLPKVRSWLKQGTT